MVRSVKSNIAYKFRIYPSENQAKLIEKTFGCVRLIYNCDLLYRYHTYKKEGKSKSLLVTEYKKDFEFLKEVDSLALANAKLNLDKAFKNFFAKRSRYPKFKSKKRFKQSYTTNNINNNIRIEGSLIKLPKLGFVKVNIHRPIKSGKLKNVTVSRDSLGDYYVSINIEYDLVKPELVKPKKILGLDYKSDGLYADSEGNIANNPKWYRKSQAKLRKLQKDLSRKQKNSFNYERNKKKISLLHKKIANQRLDFLHKESFRLANEYDMIVVENINIQNMSRSLKLGKSTHDNGFGMFRDMLKYKLDKRGKHFIKLDKFYPSTQTCSSCDNRKLSDEKLKLKDRVYKCDKCGIEIDRGLNAAINIKNEGYIYVTNKTW